MDGEATGFTDKQNRPIHYGDILQIGLGIGDRTRKRVVRGGSRIMLAGADDTELKYGGYELTRANAKQAVIIDHLHSPFL